MIRVNKRNNRYHYCLPVEVETDDVEICKMSEAL